MKYKFTKADRLRIVHEYETSDITYAELAQKHGLPCGHTIAMWRSRLQESQDRALERGELLCGNVHQYASVLHCFGEYNGGLFRRHD